ncbi:MAG: DAK2 domain-containing protein, partial [Anaerovoracaceae bacterium]
IMEHCGGASGPIWGIAFKSAGKAVGGKKTLDIADVTSLLQAAVEGIQEIGERSFGRGAVVGDKTLIDALIPCADAWAEAAKAGRSLKDAFRLGAEAAVQGAKATEDIVARMGRAGTVGERSLGHPDAGAHALGVIFTAIADAVE